MKKSQIYGLVAGLCVLGAIILFSPENEESPTTTTPVVTPPVTAVSTQTFMAQDVSTHNDKKNCYTIVNNNVYDLTAWIDKHPGGAIAIMGICGQDGTKRFTMIHGSSKKAQKTLANFQIGTLAQ